MQSTCHGHGRAKIRDHSLPGGAGGRHGVDDTFSTSAPPYVGTFHASTFFAVGLHDSRRPPPPGSPTVVTIHLVVAFFNASRVPLGDWRWPLAGNGR